jgi:hypothetical protein
MGLRVRRAADVPASDHFLRAEREHLQRLCHQGPDDHRLAHTAVTAPAAQQDTDFQKVRAAGVEQAWYVGVTLIPVGLLHSSTVRAPGIDQGYYGNDTDVTPAP